MNCRKCGFEISSPDAQFCPSCGEPLYQPKYNNEPRNAAFPHDISSVWPEWELEKRIGKGSYGVVYKAVRRDSGIESHAAIKIVSIPTDEAELDSLLSELTVENSKKYLKDVVDEFVGEIRLMESLKGTPNIVNVEDYKVVEKTDQIGWDIYIRMELLTPFNDYCKSHTLNEEEVLRLGADICTALEICGKRSIIHRDIKPENIFMHDIGYFKLGDFGIARKLENMSAGLSQKGTYNYMAPEVARGNSYDARVDIYSLGVVLYRLLNNNMLPFITNEAQLRSPNARRMAVERRINGEMIPPPCNASPETVNVVMKACSPNPNERFSSPQEMKMALNNASKLLVSGGMSSGFADPPIIIDYSGSVTGKTAGTDNGIPPYGGISGGFNGMTNDTGNDRRSNMDLSGSFNGKTNGTDNDIPSPIDLSGSFNRGYQNGSMGTNDASGRITVDMTDDITVRVNHKGSGNIANGSMGGGVPSGNINQNPVVPNINDEPPPEINTSQTNKIVEKPEKKKGKKGIIAVIAVIAALLVFGGGILLFILLGNGGNEEETTTQEITTEEESTTEEVITEEEISTEEETTAIETTTSAPVFVPPVTQRYPTTTRAPYVPPVSDGQTEPPPPVIEVPSIDWSGIED